MGHGRSGSSRFATIASTSDHLAATPSRRSTPPSTTANHHHFEVIDSERTYILQVKGLSSQSSNGTGIGIVLFDPSAESLCWEARKYLQGNRSVFEAEYSALIVALRYAIKLGVTRVVLETDHDVVQKQLVGTFNVKRETLKYLYWSIMKLREETLQEFAVHHISRSENERACELARKALATEKSIIIGLGDATMDDPMMFGPAQVPSSSSSSRSNDNNHSSSSNGENDKSKNVKSNHYFQHDPRQAHEEDALVNIDPNATYRLQFDGGARGNSGGVSGAGVVFYDSQGTEIWCGWKFFDGMSNNLAEYYALLLGLRCARSLGIRSLVAEGDSALIIKQLTGKYRVRNEKLLQLWTHTKAAMNEFDDIRLQHVFRKENKRADWLANHAMDTKSSHGFEEVDGSSTFS
jgi:ribonuclease HI